MKSDKSKPIGIFDSGMGGLTVAHAIHELLPKEKIIYFGDTKHLPYGDKSRQAIQQYSMEIVKYLIFRECKAVVIACNSASAAAGESIKKKYSQILPIIDVVEPLVHHVIDSKYKKVGIIATKATVDSAIYQNTLSLANDPIEVGAKKTPLLVPMIEEGFVNDEISTAILKTYLRSHKLDNIEALLLACTHYPLIKKEIEALLPEIDIVDSTEVTAKALQGYLQAHDLLSESLSSPNEFIISDFTETFAEQARLFFGEDVTLKTISL